MKSISVGAALCVLFAGSVLMFTMLPVSIADGGLAVADAWGNDGGGCCGGGGDRGGGGNGGDRPTPKPKPPTVTPKPSCELTVTPDVINKGGSVTLEWSTNNATTVSINQGIGAVAKSGSKVVTNVMVDTTYTLTAKDSRDQNAVCQDTVIVRIPVEKPVCDIYANPGEVMKGGSSTLTWTSENATSASIDQGIGAVAVNGSKIVHNIYYYTTYTMTVKGPGGTATCKTMVNVKETPKKPTCAIYASPMSIQQGGTSKLTWTSQNATGAWLDPMGKLVSVNGNETVSPHYTTEYVLWIWNNEGDVDSCSVKVYVEKVVEQKPSCTIWGNPSTVQTGGSSTLTWTSQNATGAWLDPLSTYEQVNGSKVVYPPYTKEYVLTVWNNSGDVAYCRTTITVNKTPHQGLPTCWVTVDKPYCSPTEDITLTWGTSNAIGAWLDPEDYEIGLSGSKNLTPGSSKTYTIWVWDGVGNYGRCDASVEVGAHY